VNSGFLQADTDEILAEIDPYLNRMMLADMQRGEFDYLHGALGMVLYFLQRRSQPDFFGRMILLLDELETIAEAKGKGWRWSSVIDSKSGFKGYDLSLSHGLASVICLLAKLRGRGVAPQLVDRLLGKAIAYLLEQARDISEYPAHFPSVIGAINQQAYYESRLAWCKGDLGVAISLLQGARATANREWEKKAIEVLLYTAVRKGAKKQGLIDAGLCHGMAGIAHIYNRIYQQTGIADFRESALYWLEQTLDLAAFADGCAGFKAFRSQKQGWIADTGLLEGIAGIGLAMLAAVSPLPPNWDEAFLLS
jgi:lantibiotic biosynthesis protein